jgi:hypothetical protein
VETLEIAEKIESLRLKIQNKVNSLGLYEKIKELDQQEADLVLNKIESDMKVTFNLHDDFHVVIGEPDEYGFFQAILTMATT